MANTIPGFTYPISFLYRLGEGPGERPHKVLLPAFHHDPGLALRP